MIQRSKEKDRGYKGQKKRTDGTKVKRKGQMIQRPNEKDQMMQRPKEKDRRYKGQKKRTR
jgi:hypothetical protein